MENWHRYADLYRAMLFLSEDYKIPLSSAQGHPWPGRRAESFGYAYLLHPRWQASLSLGTLEQGRTRRDRSKVEQMRAAHDRLRLRVSKSCPHRGARAAGLWLVDVEAACFCGTFRVFCVFPAACTPYVRYWEAHLKFGGFACGGNMMDSPPSHTWHRLRLVWPRMREDLRTQ